jgi:hypothetical protein
LASSLKGVFNLVYNPNHSDFEITGFPFLKMCRVFDNPMIWPTRKNGPPTIEDGTLIMTYRRKYI